MKTFTILIKRLLNLRLDLCPVPVPHGGVLQVLDQGHGAFELLNTRLDGVTDLPVFVLKTESLVPNQKHINKLPYKIKDLVETTTILLY